MKKIQISDYKKGLIASVVLHSLVVFALVFENINEPQTPAPQQKSIALALSSFTPAPQAVARPLEMPTPPKVCKEKLVKHEKPKKHHKPKKHKKHEKHAKKQKHLKKDAPHKVEEVAQTQVEKPLEKIVPKEESSQEVVEVAQTQQTQAKTPPMPTVASLEEQFVATNFEIIRALVLQNLSYPSLAKRMHQTGIVEILLVINEQGKLINVKLENSSGFKLLDKSAIKAAELLAGMDLPVPKNTSRIVLPVAFALN